MAKKVVVGMSGGVDSSVCAALLKEQGYEVIGLFMKNWDSFTNNDILGNKNIDDAICTQTMDYNDAKKVAKQLDIKLHVVDFTKEYWDSVFLHFIDEYKKGRTPNPDMLCNKYIKFDQFLNYALKKFKCDYIATGHYANITHDKDDIMLKAKDKNKDQTYFLGFLSEKQIEKVLFPLGGYLKSEIREMARKYDLITANKKDSTGICFIGERNFTDFLRNYIPAKEGDIINIKNNEVIGSHIGVMYYTIGQRKGIGVSGQNEPFYVCGKNVVDNTLFVAPHSDESYLISDMAIIEDVNIINNDFKEGKYKAKFRYRQEENEVTIFKEKENLIVKYDNLKAITPGQAFVFYKDEKCMGGGTIKSILKNNKEIWYVK